MYRGSLVNSHLALQTIAQRRRKSVLSEEKEIVLIETESGSVDFIIDNTIITLDFIRRYESGAEGDGQCKTSIRPTLFPDWHQQCYRNDWILHTLCLPAEYGSAICN